MLIGLHVTVYSLMASMDPAKTVRLWLFHDGLDDSDIDRLRRTLAEFGDRCELHARAVNVDEFRQFPGLYGNTMNYSRLLLPQWLPDTDRVIYLDSDLVITCDVSKIWEQMEPDQGLGAVASTTMKWGLEHATFEKMGFDMEAPYFNSGVLACNLKRWREESITAKCVELLQKYRDDLGIWDQFALNAVFYRSFQNLPREYNYVLNPGVRVVPHYPRAVLHLVGSPKPWDFAAEIVNVHSPLFYSVLDKTAYRGWRTWRSVSVSNAPRTLRRARAYYRTIKSRMKHASVACEIAAG
jgi:lipopolysaccharide biosynthesis glycosyltransferase